MDLKKWLETEIKKTENELRTSEAKFTQTQQVIIQLQASILSGRGRLIALQEALAELKATPKKK